MIVWNWELHLDSYSMVHASEFPVHIVWFLVIGMLNSEDAVPAFWLGLFVIF